MQWFAFLWFQLQMTKQYLQEKTSRLEQPTSDAANPDTPIDASTARAHPSTKYHQSCR